MNAKIMIALVAFTAVFAGCLVMADASDAEGEPIEAADTTVQYSVDGTIVLIDPVKEGSIYTVKTLEELGQIVTEGKAFAGWFKDAEFTEACNGQEVIAEGGMTLYAKWDPAEYTITYMNGETEYTTATVKTTIDAETGAVTFPTLETAEPLVALPELYSFDEMGTAQYTGIDIAEDTVIKADIIVKLVWTPVHKVTWMVGDYTVATGSTELDAEGLMSSLAQPENPVKENFDFKGWMANGVIVNTDKDGKVVYEFTADTVFTAQFTPSSLSVTFMDGEKVVLKVTVLYGDCISADKIPVGYDWDFDFSKPITEDIVIGLKAVEPVPEPEPASEPDNTTTYVLVALFGVLVIAGLVLGIRQLKK